MQVEYDPQFQGSSKCETFPICNTYEIKAGYLKTETFHPLMGDTYIIKNMEIIMPKLWPTSLDVDLKVMGKQAQPCSCLCVWKALSHYTQTLNQYLYYWRKFNIIEILGLAKFMFSLNQNVNFDITIMSHGFNKRALCPPIPRLVLFSTR